MGLLDRPVAKAIDKYFDKKQDLLQIPKDAFELAIYYDKDYYEKLFKVLYIGNAEQILRFYRTILPRKYPFIRVNYFWRVNTTNMNVLHYDLPVKVSQTMANLIFGTMPDITIENETLQQELEDIFEDNNISKLMHQAAEYESYSGAVALKPVLDPEFSEFPILMPYPNEELEINRKYGRVFEVIFKDNYEHNDQIYTLKTICGKGYIHYELYNGEKDGTSNIPCELNEIPETKNLHNLEFYANGKPYNHLLCFYKENNEDGKSDYYHIIDDFSALDEIYSAMVDYIRKSRIKTYMPESFLKEDIKTGQKIMPTEYDNDNVILYDSVPEGTTQEAKRDVIKLNDSIDGYKEAFNNVLCRALSTVGLSPASVGIEDAGANASALALSIRENMTLHTRDAKVKKWSSALQDLVRLVLDLYHTNVANDVVNITPFEEDVQVVFPTYEISSKLEKIQTLAEALNAGLTSRTLALTDLYPNMTDKQIEELKNDIENDDLQLIKSIEMNSNRGAGNENTGIKDTPKSTSKPS